MSDWLTRTETWIALAALNALAGALWLASSRLRVVLATRRRTRVVPRNSAAAPAGPNVGESQLAENLRRWRERYGDDALALNS